MKKKLLSDFSSRQYMQEPDFEIYYYNDAKPAGVSMHLHQNYEFYLFLEGQVDYQIGKEKHHMNSGDFLLIPPGVPHHPIFRSSDMPYRRFVLWLSQGFLDHLKSMDPDFAYAFDYAGSSLQCHFHADFLQHQDLQGQLIGLIEEKYSTLPFHELNARCSVIRLLLFVNRLIYEQQHQVMPLYENDLYLNLCNYINLHLNENLSLDQLAAFFFVSKFHISHVFKENMGISIHQYILKKRLQASKNSILSGAPFNDIFHEYGFSDYSSFYRAFKKEFGLSPTVFKSKHILKDDLNKKHVEDCSDTDTKQ